ncbi:hypothetical protein [Pedococcus sp. P5_B7]
MAESGYYEWRGHAVVDQLRAPVSAIEEKIIEPLDAVQVETLPTYLLRVSPLAETSTLH